MMAEGFRARWGLGALGALVLLGAGALTLPQSDRQPSVPAVSSAPIEPPMRVTARGRLEPQNGLLRIAGPSSPSVAVVSSLFVEEGTRVKEGQILATIDTEKVLEAQVQEADAQLRNAERELARAHELGTVTSDAERDRWDTQVAIARANLARVRADLVRARITSPVSALVVDIHARPGERIGPEGLLELARLDRMYAIAEVYETDIGRVRVGQRARAHSPALAGPLTGHVEWIRPKVEKLDELGTDPAARKDARIVEVKVLLDDAAAAAPFTNLQVEVEIEP